MLTNDLSIQKCRDEAIHKDDTRRYSPPTGCYARPVFKGFIGRRGLPNVASSAGVYPGAARDFDLRAYVEATSRHT